MLKKYFRRFLFIFGIISASFVSCRKNSSPVVVWTDRAEIVSYLDYYNVTQNREKAVIVYKEHLSTALPPAKDEKKPDVIIGSFLKNSKVKKYFAQLDGFLGPDEIDSSLMYESLVEYGKISGSQYLLPVSFNLPVIIFPVSKSSVVSDGNMIDCEKIKETAAVFNAKNRHQIFTNMGFAPSWNSNFLYEVAKAKKVGFNEYKNSFEYDEENLLSSVEYIKNWTKEKNDSTAAEQDFAFKYLYTPEYKQVESDRCLYSYITSDRYFSLSAEQINDLDFRWFSENGKICIEDEIITLGLYRKSHNDKAARNFIVWLLSESTQKNLLERSQKMQLDSKVFGICNGFSSIKSVNERVYPSYYRNLLGNLPSDDSLQVPLMLSPRWQSLKERVIIPYLFDAVKTDSRAAQRSLEERLNTWRKQFY